MNVNKANVQNSKTVCGSRKHDLMALYLWRRPVIMDLQLDNISSFQSVRRLLAPVHGNLSTVPFITDMCSTYEYRSTARCRSRLSLHSI